MRNLTMLLRNMFLRSKVENSNSHGGVKTPSIKKYLREIQVMSTSYHLVDDQPLEKLIEDIKDLGLEVIYQEDDTYWIHSSELNEYLRLDLEGRVVYGFTRFMGNSEKIMVFISINLQLRNLDEYTRQQYIEDSLPDDFFDDTNNELIKVCEVNNEEIWNKVRQDNPNYLKDVI